ncbi:MAG TPA: hypothetical protein VHU80_13730 [Polyangiaceae bacterium]|jgi:hypothetical protein|nr:hypothetical protein [Polyangiaceae bacterium]
MASLVLLVPALIQATAMLADEGWFHRRRGLPRWERVGHPLDTLTTIACYAWLAAARPGSARDLHVYIGLAVFSCLFITKDEFVHACLCRPGETWLHAVLFVMHPIVFVAFGALWWYGDGRDFVRAQLFLSTIFVTYQVVYWNLPWKQTPTLPLPPSTTRFIRPSATAGTTQTTTR